MEQISHEYWNTLSSQIIFISSLLCGFSIAVIANFLVAEINTKLLKSIMSAAVLAACFFLCAVFASTKIYMMTANGYPLPRIEGDLIMPSTVSGISFFIGILALISIIALSGWTKSKKMGWFTTALGLLTFIFISMMLS